MSIRQNYTARKEDYKFKGNCETEDGSKGFSFLHLFLPCLQITIAWVRVEWKVEVRVEWREVKKKSRKRERFDERNVTNLNSLYKKKSCSIRERIKEGVMSYYRLVNVLFVSCSWSRTGVFLQRIPFITFEEKDLLCLHGFWLYCRIREISTSWREEASHGKKTVIIFVFLRQSQPLRCLSSSVKQTLKVSILPLMSSSRTLDPYLSLCCITVKKHEGMTENEGFGVTLSWKTIIREGKRSRKTREESSPFSSNDSDKLLVMTQLMTA